MQQRRKHAACRAARADDQHAAIRDRHAQIVQQVLEQARAIGVVADDAILVAQAQRIDGAGALGARRQLVGELGGGELVRHRHVQAPAAAREELEHVAAEVLGGATSCSR